MGNKSYLDFGTPISFGWTAQYLDTKTCTRRQWKDSHAARFCKAYDRAVFANQQLRVPAIDKAYTAGGKQIGWCVLTVRPYKELLNAMSYSDLMAEGGMCGSVGEFIEKYFDGNGVSEVWVVNFRFSPLPGTEIQFVPTLERQFYADIHSSVSEDVPPAPSPAEPTDTDNGEDGESGEQIKAQIELFRSLRRDGKIPTRLFDGIECDRDLTVKRYLRLVNSPGYWEWQPEDNPSPPALIDDLPPNLIVEGKRITAPVKKKILGALARSTIPKNQQLTVKQLFYQMKFFGYKYDYKLEIWSHE